MTDESTDLYGTNTGIVRTDMYCHSCSKNFLAHIDFGLDGNHEVECPYCGHLHYRVIKQGKVTEARFNSDSTTTKHKSKVERGMWKSNTVPMETATVAHFLRDRWLNRSE